MWFGRYSEQVAHLRVLGDNACGGAGSDGVKGSGELRVSTQCRLDGQDDIAGEICNSSN